MSDPIASVGFIGLGTMGAPMARNLLRAGYAVRGYDLLAAATETFVAAGGAAASSPADAAAHADAVVTMLPNGEHVERALLGDGGVLAGIRPGTLVVEMSTIAPAVTDRLAAALAQRGIAMVDAPVGRSSQHAIDGKLLIMAGGSDADVARARPLLERLGDTIVHCGPSGSGARMKLVNNFLSITLNATTSEALALAQASGLDPELARSVMLGTVAGQGHLNTTYPAKVLRGDVSPGFMVDLAEKDLGLALDLGRALSLELPTGEAARDVYRDAQRDGHGREDWTTIYGLARGRLA
ncbi:MAG TPA: sulfolactaldehyde 3-reductase [Candidatus Elarobacter sp.]|jgi:4-hydroxybutyrate dehydrogenase/sulfolactaldehyde 3-reductase|nr:sulfolactaldehyde 3-reductase [Candidatus Elarobacter sp.]